MNINYFCLQKQFFLLDFLCSFYGAVHIIGLVQLWWTYPNIGLVSTYHSS
jgi:hypothetical protein